MFKHTKHVFCVYTILNVNVALQYDIQYRFVIQKCNSIFDVYVYHVHVMALLKNKICISLTLYYYNNVYTQTIIFQQAQAAAVTQTAAYGHDESIPSDTTTDSGGKYMFTIIECFKAASHV
jgi:hypothetical protein